MVIIMQYPIGKSIFAVNLLLKLSPATVANADIGSLTTLHTLLDRYLDHMLVKCERNCMVQTTRDFYFLNFFFNQFWQSADCSWNNYLMPNKNLQTTICQCSKNYGIQTRVTRLKIAPNMANPISIKGSRQYLKTSFWAFLTQAIVHCYLEFKFCYLISLRLFSIPVKELSLQFC